MGIDRNLNGNIREDNRIDGAAPLDRARARLLLGFMDDKKAQIKLEGLYRGDPDTWMKELSGRGPRSTSQQKVGERVVC